jgi:tRNA 2-selenouridine synthase
MAWLFSIGGIETEVLEGGYKSYRHLVLSGLAKKRPMIILGGFTGSGKTEILLHLKGQGHQIINLEGLANHKGSAFGSLGLGLQPTSEHFANLLYYEWEKTDLNKPLWIEDESHNIGSVFMPEEFYLNMQNNTVIVLLMDVETRMPRLIEEYSKYPAEDLVSSIRKISKRIGGDNSDEAIRSVRKGDILRAIEIVLRYYDKTYLYGIRKKQGENIVYVNTDTDDISANSSKILEAARSIPALRSYF